MNWGRGTGGLGWLTAGRRGLSGGGAGHAYGRWAPPGRPWAVLGMLILRSLCVPSGPAVHGRPACRYPGVRVKREKPCTLGTTAGSLSVNARCTNPSTAVP